MNTDSPEEAPDTVPFPCMRGPVRQRAVIGDKARDYYDQQAKKRQKENLKQNPRLRSDQVTGTELCESRDAVGKVFGVSGRTARKAQLR